MTRFVVGDDRSQSTLFPERLEDYLAEDNPVRPIDVFVDELDLARLGFGGVEPEATGRPASRCAFDGHKWPGQRDGGLQCAKCRRHQASSHCCP
jgi:hypothetical protein